MSPKPNGAPAVPSFFMSTLEAEKQTLSASFCRSRRNPTVHAAESSDCYLLLF